MKRLYFSILITILLIQISIAQEITKKFTVEEIFGTNKFSSQILRGFKWLNDGEKFSYLETDVVSKSLNIILYDIKRKKKEILLSSSELKKDGTNSRFIIMNYEFSPDGNFILFTGLLPARSIKSGGEIYLYDLKSKKFFQVETNGSVVNVKFSPNSKKLGYVKNDNLYIYDILTRSEKQLTYDGNGVVINGHFDWVYEEEFSIIDGWQFSPSGDQIFFWQLDQSPVPQIEIQQFDSLYFNSIKMRYPKAGSQNSLVKIGIINLIDGSISWVDLGNESNIYIPRVYWTSRENELMIFRLNRLQNRLDLMLADSKTGNSKVIITEIDSCWVDLETMEIEFLKDNKNFVMTSEKSGFKHIYLYNYSGNQIRQITTGNWEVSSKVSIDENKQLIYFTSGMDNPTVRNLYVIDFNGKKMKRLTMDDGTNSINISPNKKYFIRTSSSLYSVPKTYLCSIDGKILDTLIDNKNLEEVLSKYSLSKPEIIKFKTSDGVELYAQMIKPQDFDPSKKYPVLVYNYSGPGSQIVRNVWGGSQYLWHQMLAQEGYIIFMIDNRGTGGRGKAFKNIVYKNLGYWEVNDLIEGAKYLMSLPFIDGDRIGIWGWSYGGYISALAILEGNEYYKVAVSVAPVTHWKFYDTIYTERYMQTPELNPEGYERSAVINKANKLKGKLLLIHGTADDNVHFQNTVVFVDELIKSNKQFQVMFYPGKNHGIAGGKTREQLFTLITNFIKSNL